MGRKNQKLVENYINKVGKKKSMQNISVVRPEGYKQKGYNQRENQQGISTVSLDELEKTELTNSVTEGQNLDGEQANEFSFDTPKDDSNPPEDKQNEEFNTNFSGEKLKSTKKTAQSLGRSRMETANNVRQEIDTTKLGLKHNQTFALYQHDIADNDWPIVQIHKYGKYLPTANFIQTKDGKIQLQISKDYLETFKKANPDLKIPDGIEGVENGFEFVQFDIEKLKLSQNLNIEDIQIKGANTDFAIMFSALGCQINDGKTIGRLANSDKEPFDVTISKEFVQQALEGKNGCSIDKTEPAYSAVLISMINLERDKYDIERNNHDYESKAIKLELNGVALYSVPIKTNGNTEYLNIREENGKKSVYLQISNEQSNRSKTTPKFWEINEIGLQSNFKDGEENLQSLYLGVKSKDKNVTALNIDMNFEENQSSLIVLKDILSNEFERTSEIQKQKGAKSSDLSLGEENNQTKFKVTPISAESNAHIISLDGVAIFSKTGVSAERERTNEPLLNITPETPLNPNTPPSDNNPDDDRTNSFTEIPDETLLRNALLELETLKSLAEEKQKNVDTLKKEADAFKKEKLAEKKNVELPEEKTTWQKIGDWADKYSASGIFGVGILLAILSIFTPFLAISAAACCGAAVLWQVKPWVIMQESYENSQKNKEIRELIKKENTKEKINNLYKKRDKKLQKLKHKHGKIDKKRSKLLINMQKFQRKNDKILKKKVAKLSKKQQKLDEEKTDLAALTPKKKIYTLAKLSKKQQKIDKKTGKSLIKKIDKKLAKLSKKQQKIDEEMTSSQQKFSTKIKKAKEKLSKIIEPNKDSARKKFVDKAIEESGAKGDTEKQSILDIEETIEKNIKEKENPNKQIYEDLVKKADEAQNEVDELNGEIEDKEAEISKIKSRISIPQMRANNNSANHSNNVTL